MVEPIAVIGSGCRFPGGADTPTKLWSLIQAPPDLSSKPPTDRFNIGPFYHPVGTHHGTTNATKSYFLLENIAQFDAGFFNIQPSEVEAMDPQQRVLMEVVYDGLCAAGQPMEKLRGSDTAVYVGMMSDDWSTMITRDWETLPRYTATGLERGIMANRVSYFFDWHGPSMTLDTACSSSLVALDLAVQALRSGKSKVALAAGTNLILSPAMYISESNLGMLSPKGRCAMWDVSADGYARGEGVAAVILKTLSQALADNDPIECIIRETAVNQDGRTSGLTMPSSIAQAGLIRECYAKAGLDPFNKPEDRPQFFHAHGTGTQAGDPQEAEAISSALFPTGSPADQKTEKLLVGSIKTVIGHTESTAGLASLISTSMALKYGVVPPNLHFQNVSPKVAPFFKHLEIPSVATPWPTTREGGVKRASVNSFGFGGTNAHCIVEEHVAKIKTKTSPSTLLFTPLIFSAASETALRTMLSQYLAYLEANPTVDLHSLAFTLQHRRSTFAYRKTIATLTVQDAIQSLKLLVNPSSDSEGDAELGTRFRTPHRPAKILGIFTGQGAQWPRMGAQIIESSPFASSRIAELDAALQSLPCPSDRPVWTLRDQLLADREVSRLAEAALSQPLCTAVQIVLVDVLRAAGISFTAVVGHSSGEICAAYAAGLLSAKDAIRIAYFRGLYAKLASSPSPHAPRGAMIAVGMSAEDARAFCLERLGGRVQVAAINSNSSITLSGDDDAVDEAEDILRSQSIFARKLKVDTAYHSTHMTSCVKSYLASLEDCGVKSIQPKDTTTVWYSSVFEKEAMTKEKLNNQYWVDNMCNAVLFAGAISHAVQSIGTFDLGIEVGPHPALKGPATTTVEDVGGAGVPYTGLLSRGQNDIKQLSLALGFLWTQLGSDSVDFSAAETLLSGAGSKTVLQDLPSYPFDHGRTYWTGSRVANHFKHRNALHVPNPVLGNPCSEATTPGEFQWRNILQPGDMPWLKGHMLQGQTVFPATGYVSMAIEAIKALVLETRPDVSISIFKLTDVEIPRAIAFNDDAHSVETVFSVTSINTSADAIAAEWACYSVAEGSGSAALNAKGGVSCQLSPMEADTIPLVKGEPYNLVAVDEEHFYTNLSSIGYDYSIPFRGLSNIRRKLDYSAGTLSDQSESNGIDNLMLHPGMLDSALQTVLAAWSFPGDTEIWSLHVPVSISAITVNPHFTILGEAGQQKTMQYESFIRSKSHSEVIGDICLHTNDGSHTFVHFEGAALVPFSRALAKNDLPMFSYFEYKVASPDGQLAAAGETLSEYEVQMYKDVDRIAYWFARDISMSIPPEERYGLLPHFQSYLKWCDRMVGMVSRNENPKVPAECNMDTRQDIAQILSKYEGRKDIRFIEVVGDNLASVIRSDSSMLEHMNQDGLLRAFYEENAICAGPTSRWLARLLAQISHRFPATNILEIGAGTGATTSSVLGAIGGAYASYTFTDISSGFFMVAEERFREEAGRMTFKTFNMEKSPSSQGFVEGKYDVVLAVNVLHVSTDIETTMSNVRRLLKPGGFVIVGELTSTELLFSGMTVGTLPGWWIGSETGRPWGPLFTLNQWDAVLKKTGFAGIDTVTPDINASLPISVFLSQAVDDRVTLLRAPLSVKEHPIGVNTDSLAIIGGTSLSVHKLSRDISDVIGRRFHKKEFFDTMEDFASSHMAKSALYSGAVTVLSLTDLDNPYLENLTTEKFDALKVLWAVANTLVWVTCGSREDNPYSYMMIGIANTVKTEHPNLTIQMYDLESTSQGGNGIQPDTATKLAETLLRQLTLHSWGTDSETLFWTAEPQIFVSHGKELITRLLPDQEKNDRYNSQRRDVFTRSNPAKELLQLVGIEGTERPILELQKVSPLKLEIGHSEKYRTVQITNSILQSLALGAVGFQRLCTGIDVETGEIVLALSGSSESLSQVPASRCIVLCNKLSPSTLLAVASNLLAEKILSLAPEGSTILVNEADIGVQSALESKAHHRNINIVFTTSKLQQRKSSNSVFLHPNFPKHAIQSVVPPATALFFHFSRGSTSDAVRVAIDKCLPSACLRINEKSVLSHQVHEPPGSEPSTIAKILQSAWDDADKVKTPNIECISLETVSNHTPLGERLAVVDWTAAESVTTKVQSINSGTMFRADKTYLLVGMAGELGQSLAGWMIRHGAQCVVLSSRTPKVNPRFIEDMKKEYGAVINSVSLDVTSRKSLQSVHAAISATLPPIAGVINGAMVLEDELFAKMTHDQFERVTRPKVLGTQLLDEIFHDDTSLDFFIVASSIASVIGWSGQSNYSAANEYITSLVCNRRKRGVVGSAINIPAVVGVGYAAHSETFSFKYFQSLGYINISEEDLHTLFAEAILSGRPGQPESVKAQVVMGVNYIPSDLNVKEVHKRDVKFNHMIQHEENSSEVQTDRKAGVRVKVKLQSTKNPEELYTIILDSFIAHLKRMLRITEEEEIADSASLFELGVDSLVVVDIRSWFLKELGIDVPTLKILGGAGSIGDLVKTALEKMPELQEPTAVQTSREGQADMVAKPNETARISSSEEQTSSSSPTSSGSPTFTPAQAASPLLSDSESVSTTQPSDEVDKDAIDTELN